MTIPYRQLVGLNQAHSGDYRNGLGLCCGLGQGQEYLEPGSPGYQDKYGMTTKPNATFISKPEGRAPATRRVDLTQAVQELEWLVGTPGVHHRVLAQKIWDVRRRLMGSSGWSWASYSQPGAYYDTSADLLARLEAVERVLGAPGASAKLMSQLSGGLGTWGQSDPMALEKLAACIKVGLCKKSLICCPPRRGCPQPQQTFAQEELQNFPRPVGTVTPVLEEAPAPPPLSAAAQAPYFQTPQPLVRRVIIGGAEAQQRADAQNLAARTGQTVAINTSPQHRILRSSAPSDNPYARSQLFGMGELPGIQSLKGQLSAFRRDLRRRTR